MFLGRPSSVLQRASCLVASPCASTVGLQRMPAVAPTPCRSFHRAKVPKVKPKPLRRLEYQPEVLLKDDEKAAMEDMLAACSLFPGQQGVLFQGIVREFRSATNYITTRIAPNAISFLYSHCQNLEQLQAVMLLHKAFRASSGDQGGGSHSISHNAVVACLRLNEPGIALDLLMDKYFYSVWPPAATYSLVLDFLLAKLHSHPDLLTEVYEAACIVQRDGVDCTPTLASLCVVALSLPNPAEADSAASSSAEEGKSEGEAGGDGDGSEGGTAAHSDPPVPYTQPNLPGWEEKVKCDRQPPHWTQQLETKYERGLLAYHVMETHRAAGKPPPFPVAYFYLLSCLGRLGKYDKMLSVMRWVKEDNISSDLLVEIRSQLSGPSTDEGKIAVLEKLSAGDSSVLDRLLVPLPRDLPHLSHTVDGQAATVVFGAGLSCDMTAQGTAAVSTLRTEKHWADWEAVDTYHHFNRREVKVRSRYKMRPKRVHFSEVPFVKDYAA